MLTEENKKQNDGEQISKTDESELSKDEEPRQELEQISKEIKLGNEGEGEKQDNIVIHTMPERFRIIKVGASKARMTGLLIFGGGGIVLIAMSILLYFFIFRDKASQPIEYQAPSQAFEERKTEVSTELSQEPSDKEVAKEIITEQASPLSEEFRVTTSTPEETIEKATTTPPITSTTSPTSLSLGVDTDGDGLTDKEEALLGTNSQAVDSDGDGYNDLAEIENLYDPADSGKLIDNQAIQKFTNESFGYSLLFPNIWESSTVGGDDSIIFRSPDNQFIQIIVQTNSSKDNIEEWYKKQFKLASLSALRIVQEQNWQGVESEDGLIIYLTGKAKKNYIFIITYNPGTEIVLHYLTIFELVKKSFVIENNL